MKRSPLNPKPIVCKPSEAAIIMGKAIREYLKTKQKMENIQVLNDGADEKDFKELLEILKQFGQVEVLYNPDDPKDKDVTGDEVIERYENFKKQARENDSKTKRVIQKSPKRVRRREGQPSKTDTTISAAA